MATETNASGAGDLPSVAAAGPERGAAPEWLEEFEHTADAGFEVTAPTLPELYCRAAWALFAVIADLGTVEPRETLELTVTAPDREALLVRWLSELNYQHIVGHRLYCRFEMISFEERRLVARARGEPVDLARHTVYTEIKAVTFHGLRIEPAGEGWRARVILDL